jgi:hypothetical protein
LESVVASVFLEKVVKLLLITITGTEPYGHFSRVNIGHISPYLRINLNDHLEGTLCITIINIIENLLSFFR